MTHEELLNKSRAFMVATRGRPGDQDEEARERWYQDLGLLAHFLSYAFQKYGATDTDRTTTAGGPEDDL